VFTDDQDALLGIREIAIRWANFLELGKEPVQIGEAASGTCIIGIPGLLDLREFFLEAED
jgi:hypothetical protein